jgi:hypothetical protein
MAQLFTKGQQTTIAGQGSLAAIYKPTGKGEYAYVNVTNDYQWTLSEAVRSNAPRVILREFQVNETTIRRQAAFYGSGAVEGTMKAVAAGAKGVINAGMPAAQQVPPSEVDILGAYRQLYPKDRPTGFVYDLPYFSDINFEVNTPMWASLDTLEAAKGAISGLASLAKDKAAGEAVSKVMDFAGASAMAGLASTYPKVGITDRPRLWNSHEPRSITIKFPLFNTYSPNDWMKNRELCELLVNQNLYNKRDFITSIPPVFYELLIPGQHYSWASCVTNLTIYNRGNMRLMSESIADPSNVNKSSNYSFNVPDVYEINITFTDMVMPSKNMFQSINDSKVTTELADPKRKFTDGFTDTGIQDLYKGGATVVNKGKAILKNLIGQ